MANASGYGMKAMASRKPSRMPKKKSSKDSGDPIGNAAIKTKPGVPGGSSPDSGKPNENR